MEILVHVSLRKRVLGLSCNFYKRLNTHYTFFLTLVGFSHDKFFTYHNETLVKQWLQNALFPERSLRLVNGVMCMRPNLTE